MESFGVSCCRCRDRALAMERKQSRVGKIPDGGQKFIVAHSPKQPCFLQIDSSNRNIKILDPKSFNGYSLLKELSQFSTVVYITKWTQQQKKFCIQMPGIFQYDEKQDCDELFKYANIFDITNGTNLAKNVIDFASICSTGVSTELKSYTDKLKIRKLRIFLVSKRTRISVILFQAMPLH